MMKPTFKLVLAIALACGSAPALALQLGQIRVKSALDEPLVAEIPIQLDNLTEAKGLSVSLASPADFARAGLSRTGLEGLHFSVIADSTGHKLVLVTSEQPIGDPYLDFLVQVDTSKGKQLREYTVLLDPVIASPAPTEQSAPAQVPAAPPAATPEEQAPPPASQPAPQQPAFTPAPAPQFAPAPAPPAPAPSGQASAPVAPPPPGPAAQSERNGEYDVKHGNTLYQIAQQTRSDSQVSLDQMMLALKKTNPDAFFRDNINSLKSGAILRIPTRDAIDETSAAAARAEVHRQYEDWRGEAARKNATVVENNAAPSAQPARGKPAAGSESDRLALVPPTQGGGSGAGRPGEKGGTGNSTVAGLKQQLDTAKESLASIKQENADLQSRVKDLEDISGKNQKLLAMKDAEIAELQRKLDEAQKQATKIAAAAGAPSASPIAKAATSAVPQPAVAGSAAPASAASVAKAQGSAATSAATKNAAGPTAAEVKPLAQPPASKQAAAEQGETGGVPWYRQPIAWVIAGIVIVVLILLGLMRRRPRPLPDIEPASPSLADQFGDSPLAGAGAAAASADEDAQEQALQAQVAAHPGDLDAHLALCRFHYEHDDAAHFIQAAAAMRAHVGNPAQAQWQDVLAMGEQIAPSHALFVAPLTEAPAPDNRYEFTFDEPPVAEPGAQAPQPPAAGDAEITRRHDAPQYADEFASRIPVAQKPGEWTNPAPAPAAQPEEPAFSDDPVDTKLDLARAYLDMGDPAGARAMLEEVLNEGSQPQKEEAQRLLGSLK